MHRVYDKWLVRHRIEHVDGAWCGVGHSDTRFRRHTTHRVAKGKFQRLEDLLGTMLRKKLPPKHRECCRHEYAKQLIVLTGQRSVPGFQGCFDPFETS